LNDQISSCLPGYLDFARIGPISAAAAGARSAAGGLAARVAPEDLDRLFARTEQARASAARLVGASPHEIAFAPSTSNGLFSVAAALPGRGTLLVPRAEFPANLYPWLRFAGRGGPAVRPIGAPLDRHITPELLAAQLDPGVTALTVSAVDSLTGHLAPLAALKEALGPDRLLIVDAIQGLGAVPLELDAADVVVSGGQKWLRSGWGAALLLIRDRVADRLRPGLGGWAGATDPFATGDVHPTPALPGAAAHQATNPDYPATAAFGAAVEELLGTGVESVGGRIRAVLAELLDPVRRYGGEVLLDRLEPGRRGGIASFRMPGRDPDRVHRLLGSHGLVTTRRDDWVRLSPHCDTGPEAVELLTAALRDLTR
jgi:selenocysteine lyase/cysteine desulfurase